MWIEKNGPTWRIRDLVGGRKVTIKQGYSTKTAAKAALVEFRADKQRGTALMPRGGEITLAEWVEMWWPSYRYTLKHSAQRSETSRVRTHILPALGHLALDDIDTLVIQKFISSLSAGEMDPADDSKWIAKPLSPKSVRNVSGVLHKILSAAVAAKRIRVNPANDAGMPPKEHKEMFFLTPPEIERLLAACPDRWYPLVLLLVSTGLRLGEALGLKVGRLDVLAGVLRVEETIHEAAGGEHVFTTPKSPRSRRSVRFPLEVAAELTGLVIGKTRHDLVFTEPDGRPITRNFRQRVWPKIRDAAGLPGLRLHDLRHTFAAIQLSSGRVSLTALQITMGHSSAKTTSDLYGHLLPEATDTMVEVISAALPKILSRGLVGGSAGDQPRSTAISGA